MGQLQTITLNEALITSKDEQCHYSLRMAAWQAAAAIFHKT